MKIQILTKEPLFEFCVNAQQIMHDQHLSIAIFARADANNGNAQGFGHFFSQQGRDFFQDDAKATSFFQ